MHLVVYVPAPHVAAAVLVAPEALTVGLALRL
jgi:hypothetical protein